MLPLVEFPELVEHYAPYFTGIFSEPAFVEFKRYISGLIVSENKTVEGINRLMVHESRNQSSLNRLLTRSPFSVDALNRARLALLDSVPGTQMKPRGILSVDDTLLTHYGRKFEHIAYLFDSAERCYTWAHNLVTLHYSDDETDYPVLFQLWKPVDLEGLEAGLVAAGIPLKANKQVLKEEAPGKWRSYLLGVWRRHQKQPEVAALYDSKLNIAERLITEWVQTHPDANWPVTFDAWYTQPAFCRYLDKELGVSYVGSLDKQNELLVQGGRTPVAEFARQLKEEHQAAIQQGLSPVFRPVTIRYRGEKETYYCYCQTHRVRNFGKVRLVISHRHEDLSDDPKFTMTNHLLWQAAGILRIRRHRWPIEVYHEEGKAEGLDQYQLRDFGAVYRHIALVAVVYSLLRAAQHDPALRDKLQRELKFELEGSAALWRRASQAQSLWNLALFIGAGLAQGHSLRQLMAPFLRAMCAL
jgi:hypothetical protein